VFTGCAWFAGFLKCAATRCATHGAMTVGARNLWVRCLSVRGDSEQRIEPVIIRSANNVKSLVAYHETKS
jgi:hypothetical protein